MDITVEVPTNTADQPRVFPPGVADGAHPAPGGESAAHLTEAELAGQLIGDARQIRVLTGDRPTGALHLGHYLGSLRNRVRLADAGAELFVLVADYQVITDRDASASIADHAGGLVADYLAIGLDPARSTIFAHSAVPALNQLLLPLMSLISVPELERNPTTKAEAAASGRPALSALMLTYPVHQAADILFCRADLVPVGKDQLPHLEVTRTVARRFNTRYTPVFTEPKALISDAPSVLGSDGHKMSKSHGNTIALQAGADETAAIIKGFKTDTDRHITYDPEHRPEVSNLVLITALCRGEDPRAVAERIGSGGAAALKQAATEAVNEHLRPIRARRAELAGDRGYLSAILRRGAERATGEAEATLARVREAMGMAY
ncbi:tryptophan--tRNA ligase [Catenulispora sp. NL8]|uniref:Tryptophan--tRNA ligase n=1 Tax=Catenulispora pinistramenti TaxID=2705254 RepID=A0ABS5L5L1_9ACTN|nr:tryptophan--tRNA ligase [Catenulispora pinistramenti]